LRVLNQKTNAIAAQATPMRSLFAPVMLAMAKLAYSLWGILPACQVMYISTAYSGRTAIRATAANANDFETSDWAASQAQSKMNEDPRIARPDTSAISCGGIGHAAK